jgi:hypothetical protein
VIAGLAGDWQEWKAGRLVALRLTAYRVPSLAPVPGSCRVLVYSRTGPPPLGRGSLPTIFGQGKSDLGKIENPYPEFIGIYQVDSP